jgi:hypothetical protein
LKIKFKNYNYQIIDQLWNKKHIPNILFTIFPNLKQSPRFRPLMPIKFSKSTEQSMRGLIEMTIRINNVGILLNNNAHIVLY